MAIPTYFKPIGNTPAGSATLIESALAAGGITGGFKQFYETAFAEAFGGVKWRDLFAEGAPSVSETYTQVKSEKGLNVMARYVAFDAEAPLISPGKFSISSGDMPRMKLATSLNEKSLRETLRIVNLMGGSPNLESLYNDFLVSQTKLIGGLHSQINYTAFQIESTGKYISTEVNNGGGLIALEFDFNIPQSNKKNPGEYGGRGARLAWSDSAANPIGDLQDMVEYATNHFIPHGVFRMNKATWLTFINHPNVRQAVNVFATRGMISESNLNAVFVPETEVYALLSALGLPPIEIVDELSPINAFDPNTRTVKLKYVRGFEDNIVLLRPAGAIGSLQWSNPVIDFATNDNPIYLTEGGKFSVQRVTYSKDKAMEFQAEFTGLPVLEIPDHMLYLDVSTATPVLT